MRENSRGIWLARRILYRNCDLVKEWELEVCIAYFSFKINWPQWWLWISRFPLKSSGYAIKDWEWLMENIWARIYNWYNGWLSSGGRLTLVKVMLEVVKDSLTYLLILSSVGTTK